MIIRDTVAIKSVGAYFIKESTELQELKTNIIKQIKEIESQFKGEGANDIIENLESFVNDLSLYLDNINYYGDFMVSLANHDTEIISKTKKDLLNIGAENE